MPRTARAMAAAIMIVALQGCYHSRILTNAQPATDYQSETVHAFFWGLMQENVAPENCVSNAMQEVRVSWNLGYSLITIATLGIWSPIEVQWKCGKQPSPTPIGQ